MKIFSDIQGPQVYLTQFVLSPWLSFHNSNMRKGIGEAKENECENSDLNTGAKVREDGKRSPRMARVHPAW